MDETWDVFFILSKVSKHNETIEGMDEAMLQMSRERRRRKRLKLPKLDEDLVRDGPGVQ